MTDPIRPTPYLVPKPVRGRIARAQPLGLPVINMGFNELPYPPTPKVAEALSQSAAQLGRYGSPGCDGLRAALGRVWGLDPDRLICGNGSEELLDVIARNTTFVYRGQSIDIRQLAQSIGATYVVEGSVRRSGERIRVTVQLIDAPSPFLTSPNLRSSVGILVVFHAVQSSQVSRSDRYGAISSGVALTTIERSTA